MRSRRPTLSAVVLLLSACSSEQRADEVTPVHVEQSHRRSAAASSPSPLIAAPHVRRTEAADHSARPYHGARAAAGGGFGSRPEDWNVHPEPEPDPGEVQRFRERLDRALNDRDDPGSDPCAALRDMAEGGRNASERSGEPSGQLPGRAEMAQLCRSLPEAYRRCLEPDYAREHAEECAEQTELLVRRGERARRRGESSDEGARLLDEGPPDEGPPGGD